MTLKEEILYNLNEEDKSGYKKMKFVRWGGLSPTDHKKIFKNKKMKFHTPPTKKGIYVFAKNLVEPFLIAWKIYSEDEEGNSLKKNIRKKEFTYQGKIWTHLYDSKMKVYNQKGSWYETDTDSLSKILPREINKIRDHQGSNVGFTKDHLEFYIDKKHLGGL